MFEFIFRFNSEMPQGDPVVEDTFLLGTRI